MMRIQLLLAGMCLTSAAAASAADTPSVGWSNYNNGLNGQRYSPLAQINTDTVANLKPVCSAEVGEFSTFETGPIVVGDLLYATTSHTTVAIDARSCRIVWQFADEQSAAEIHPTNRGVAYAEGRLFRGTADGHLLALDALKGTVIWRSAAAEPRHGEFFNAAPVVWKNRLYIATSGGDWTGSGRMMAYDARSGKELWRFNLIPREGEPGFETWKLPPGKKPTGGGSWSSYALDPTTGEIFVSVGNPAPALSPDEREGSNLYTNSVVALDALTGKLRWYYQILPNDGLDYDLAAAPLLFTTAAGRPTVAVAGKNGFVYLIDRRSHRLIAKTAVTTIENADIKPTTQPTRICPGIFGGVVWNGPAFDPDRETVYVGSIDQCMMIVHHGLNPKGLSEQTFGTNAVPLSQNGRATGWLYAIEASTGTVRWKHATDSPVVSGVTPTAGGLVFAGTVDGELFALDSKNGHKLYQYDAGGMLGGGVITYRVSGRQYLAFVSGGIIRGAFMRHAGRPKITIMALNADSHGPAVVNLAAFKTGTPASYGQLCALCHGPDGRGIDAPALRGNPLAADPQLLSQVIKHPGLGMPSYYPDVLSDNDIAQLAVLFGTWK